MHILVDAKDLALARGTGIATYTRNVSLINGELGNSVDLLHEFRPFGRGDRMLDEISFYDRQYGSGRSSVDRMSMLTALVSKLLLPHKAVRARPLRIAGFVDSRPLGTGLPHFDRILTAPLVYRLAWAYFSLTGRFLPVRIDPVPDLVHWTLPFPIRHPGTRNVYTVHDLIPLKSPFSTLDNKTKFRRLNGTIAATADQIVTVSETTTKDLLEVEPAAALRISNTFQSVKIPAEHLARSDEENAKTVANLFGFRHRQFLLFFSAIEPKKNLGRLIEAHLGSSSPFPLVIVGTKAWLAEPELQGLRYEATKAAQAGGIGAPKARVALLDYVSFDILMTLIRSARAVLFPSIYEGFGLPILESMVCGTPVMTSNFGAMREIGGAEAALLVNPFDVREMRQAIESLSRDDALCRRLSAAGLLRAELFSWDRYRGRLAAAYDKAVA